MKKTISLFTSIILLSCNSEKEADAYGNFETVETVVSSQTNGKINFIKVDEGQEINANEMVVSIDTLLLHQQKLTLLANQQTVNSKKPNIESQVAIYRNQIKTSEAQLKALKNEQSRIKNLLKEGAATPKQLDDINAQIDVIINQINVQKSQLCAQNIQLNSQSSTYSNEVNSIEEQIKQINIQIAQSKIVNPFTGVITAKYVEPNEIVSYGKPLYKIADLSSMILRAYFSGDQLSKIKLNQEVVVRIDVEDGKYKEYKGRINWISSKSEFTPKIIQTKKERVNFVYAVKVLVKNDGSLKMGMPGEIILK